MTGQREQDVKALRQLAQQLLVQDHFSALGIARTAPPDEVHRAFVEAAKQWHPDRAPQGLEELKPLFAQVFRRLDVARATLSDPTRRLRYVEELATPVQSAHAGDASAAEASMALKKAEALLKKNDAAAAERYLQRAVQLAPALVEARALLTWIQVKPTSSPVELKKLTAELDALIARDDSSARARFFRGQLRKRLDLTSEANADFVRASELDPNHIDAQREIRLYRMRTEKSAPTPAKPKRVDAAPDEDAGVGAFFRKLFKR